MVNPSSFEIAGFWKWVDLAGAGFETGATERALSLSQDNLSPPTQHLLHTQHLCVAGFLICNVNTLIPINDANIKQPNGTAHPRLTT
jgi:hypothetical protein